MTLLLLLACRGADAQWTFTWGETLLTHDVVYERGVRCWQSDEAARLAESRRRWCAGHACAGQPDAARALCVADCERTAEPVASQCQAVPAASPAPLPLDLH